jgi:hypothetical protein
MWAKLVRRIKKSCLILIFLIFLLILVLGNIYGSNKLNKIVTLEAGRKAPDVSEFMKDKNNSGTFITNLSEINMNTPGIYDIKIQIGKRVYSSKLEVKDTVAPAAEPVNQEIWPMEMIEAKEFVKNIIDAADVKISYKEQPDFSKTGVQEIFLILEDTSGNKTELKASLTIKADTEAPKIEGVNDKTVYIDDKVSYKKGITVTDNKDKNVELVVDSSAVNIKKAGSYKVIYTAADLAGNTATKIMILKVKEKNITQEDLNILADKVLAGIINPGMTPTEKALAIYNWTKHHITYTGSSDKSSWIKGAVQGIKNGTGDCFNYYATSRALLTRAGFKTLCVMRVGGKTQHFWNLVYIKGGWYHFDTTPSHKGYAFVCFMRTDAEVAEYSKWRIGYYNFDKTKYPATPLNPFK